MIRKQYPHKTLDVVRFQIHRPAARARRRASSSESQMTLLSPIRWK